MKKWDKLIFWYPENVLRTKRGGIAKSPHKKNVTSTNHAITPQSQQNSPKCPRKL